jgi:glycerol-3-phosphate acyltransferase PlsX
MAHDNKHKIRIAVDAMGGDYAPGEIVKGAVMASQKGDVEIFLVGAVPLLEKELAKHELTSRSSIHIVEANEVVREGESPATAVRNKPNSSIAVAARLVKTKEADALVSAGATGATAVSAILFMGMLDGIYRPAIVGSLGSFAPNTVIVDFGANMDCKPHQFLDFAIVGSVYAKKFLNIIEPKIALLNTGSEEGKGNEAVRQAYHLLKSSGLNFVGNIEGNEILSGKANVIVCDGFVGNILLKFYESIADYALRWTKKRLRRHPPLLSLVTLLFHRLFPATEIASETNEGGGGLLWGVNGIARIAHGASRATNIVQAIESAKKAVRMNVVETLKLELAKYQPRGRS